MRKIVTTIFALAIFLFAAHSVFAYTFPSTNQLNKDMLVPGREGQLAPYVNLVEASLGKVKLDFVGGYSGGAFFEYRIDGLVKTSGTAHPVTGDFIYPGVWVVANTTVQREFSANEYVEVRLALGGERDWDFDWTRFDVLTPPLEGKDVRKVTGSIWMSNPSQQIQFSTFDKGATVYDKGDVEYWNYEYPGTLHYTANVLCANVNEETKDARFMFQIPEGWPGLTGLYVVASVHDGGSPGTNGDTYGHAATGDLTAAKNWCENGVSVANYEITDGNLVVHK